MADQTPVVEHTLSIQKQLVYECDAMLRYAYSSGLKVPPSAAEVYETVAQKVQREKAGSEQLSPADIKKLSRVHSKLALVVAPANPRSILLVQNHRSRSGTWLVTLPLVRNLMIAAFACLIFFVLTGLSPYVNQSSGDMLNSSGYELLVNQVHFLAAAGMGAAFFALFRINRYVANTTFDPKYEASYWVRFSLGLISGPILGNLVDEGVVQGLGRSTLAMLGGFSAEAVYQVLNRLVDTVTTMVKGDSKVKLANTEALVKARFQEEARQVKGNLMASLVRLEQEASSGLTPEELRQKVDQVLDELILRDMEGDDL